MKVCITGGGGYIGSKLVPRLLACGHKVTVLDTFWFGDHLPKEVKKIKGDIRSRVDLRKAFEKQDAIIHLACISNDPSFDLNPNLGRTINYTCFKDILSVAQESCVKRFIYASSSSIYGVSDLMEVREDAPKNPLTDYSKYKLACENDLKSFGMGGAWTIVRPATVCGYAPRLRLDLVVNILSINALVNKKMTIFGKYQKRPNIHVTDMARAYEFLLGQKEEVIDKQEYNVGFENKSLSEIALTIKDALFRNDIKIEEEPTNDPRSYHINSDKFLALGFIPKYDIKEAVWSIKEVFDQKKLINPLTNPNYSNIKRMKEIGL